MGAYHEIQIRFIRRLQSSEDTDDILRITRLGDNQIQLIYKENTGPRPEIDIMRFNYQQMMSYLYRVFWIVSLDEDPFHSIQFFIPGYSTFIVGAADVKTKMAPIMDLIISTVWNWPNAGTGTDCSDDRVSSQRPRLRTTLVGSPEESADGGNDRDGADSL